MQRPWACVHALLRAAPTLSTAEDYVSTITNLSVALVRATLTLELQYGGTALPHSGAAASPGHLHMDARCAGMPLCWGIADTDPAALKRGKPCRTRCFDCTRTPHMHATHF